MDKRPTKLIAERIFWAMVIFGLGWGKWLYSGNDPLHQFKDAVLFITTFLTILLITKRHPRFLVFWVIVYDLGDFIAQVVLNLKNFGTFYNGDMIISTIMNLFPMPILGSVVIAGLIGWYLNKRAFPKPIKPDSGYAPSISGTVLIILGVIIFLLPMWVYYAIWGLRSLSLFGEAQLTTFFNLCLVWKNVIFAPLGAILLLIGFLLIRNWLRFQITKRTND